MLRSPYRVLFANELYPPYIGGAELQTQVLARGLAARGHTVSVATYARGDAPAYESDGDVAVHRLRAWWTWLPWFFDDPSRRYPPPLPDPGIVVGLRRLIRRFQPDIVHTSGWMAYSAALAIRNTPSALVLSMRDYGYSCAIRTLMHNGERPCDGPAITKCLQCAAHRYGWPKNVAAVAGVLGGQPLLAASLRGVHTVSTYVAAEARRDFLSHQGRLDVPIAPIPGIMPSETDASNPDAASHDELDSILARLPADPFILFVGALQPHKGLGTLLQAYEQLADAPPLVLIGTVWPETPAFPPDVTVLSNLPHRAVLRVWERCLFGVVPSLWPEPLAGTVREGMSKAKAVIGTTLGGTPDMIKDGETGLLIEPGDAVGLRNAMSRLIADPALCDRIGCAAYDHAQRYFAADAVLPQFEALYALAIDGK